MKKVSVILTTYNSQDCILKTIDSILNQDGINELFSIELIIVDDCSTDNTTDILKQRNIPFLSTSKNSGGPNAGRNIGLKAVTGDYICIADHDDEWNPNKIKTMLPYFKEVSIVTSGYTLEDINTKKEIVRVNEHEGGFKRYSKNTTFLDKLKKNLTGQNTYLGSIMYAAELKHILFEEHFGVVDFDWILMLFHQQESIEVSQSLYRRYVDGKNLSLDENYRRKDFYYTLYFIERYERDYPKAYKIGYKKVHGSRARYYYLMDNMPKARFYFLKSGWSFKTVLYYLELLINNCC